MAAHVGFVYIRNAPKSQFVLPISYLAYSLRLNGWPPTHVPAVETHLLHQHHRGVVAPSKGTWLTEKPMRGMSLGGASGRDRSVSARSGGQACQIMHECGDVGRLRRSVMNKRQRTGEGARVRADSSAQSITETPRRTALKGRNQRCLRRPVHRTTLLFPSTSPGPVPAFLDLDR